MSAADNKQLIKDIFAGIANGDGSLFYEHLAEDATLVVTGEYSWARTYTGKQSIRRDLYGVVRARLARDVKSHAFQFLADEDWVVVEARGDMVTKEGTPYCNHYCLFYRLQHRMIVEMKEYQDSTMCERVLGPYPGTPVAG